MSRMVKQMIEDDLKQRYAELDEVLVVSVHGLSGNDVNEFRGRLRDKSLEVHVVKNSAVRRALAGTPLEPIAANLDGPCAFVTGDCAAIDAAKTLVELTKEYPNLELRNGMMEDDTGVYSVDEMSKFKNRAELQGEVLMLIISPSRRLAGCLNIGGQVAGCIKAVADKLEKGETISKVA